MGVKFLAASVQCWVWMAIISSKRELVQVAGYSKVNLKAKYSSYLWLDEFIF